MIVLYILTDPESVNMKDQEWGNPHCIATVLKMYFQELPICLFTEEKYNDLIEICKSECNNVICSSSYRNI